MERIMNSDERIRRAEEIYYRRRNNNPNIRNNYYNSNKKIKKKKSVSLLKKLILQIILCVIIYIGIYVIQNKNFIFSEEFLNKVDGILSYDVEIEKYINSFMSYFNSTINDKQNSIESEDPSNPVDEVNNVTENVVNETGEVENIGGLESNEIEKQDLSQMEIDANDIKNTYNLIKPLEGTITSRFGQREPTTPTVPKNHTGIDIAATTGTKVVAALDGIVEVASNEGDYGKHLKIKKDDVTLVYAHCNKLLKKQGDKIKQGDVIAEVGSTRKCNRTALTL